MQVLRVTLSSRKGVGIATNPGASIADGRAVKTLASSHSTQSLSPISDRSSPIMRRQLQPTVFMNKSERTEMP
jgi:hypothetical protein